MFGEAALGAQGLCPAFINKVCKLAIAEAKECRQSMLEKAGADTTDTHRYVLVGAPRHLLSVDVEHSVDLAICERLIESGSGLCLVRMMIECFLTQDHHVTVDTVQARLATHVKSEFHKLSAVCASSLPRNAAWSGDGSQRRRLEASSRLLRLF